MKVFLFLIIVIFGARVAKAQNGWIDYRIDNKLSVKLPKEPTPIKESSVYVRDKDTTAYIISTFDCLKTADLDSVQLASSAPTVSFAENFKNGIVGKMPGTTLGQVNIGKWNGYTSYRIEGGNTSKKLKLYIFTVIIGTNLYSLMVISHDNYNPIVKDSFFASLVLN